MDGRKRDTRRPDKDNRLMRLAGQDKLDLHTTTQQGYAMAALLVGLAVMSVLMGAMLPVWSHMVRRDKEAELVFRGQQYARAIGLFERKFANTPPPTIDVLVEQRFLRKKYKDPITKDDFQPIYANQGALGAISAPSGAQRPGQQATTQLAVPAPTSVAGGTAPNGAVGGIIGVTSKSKDTSIRLYNGRDKYNEWAFVYLQTAQRPGGPVGAGGIPAGRGGPGGQGGQGPGGRGGPNAPGGPFGMGPGAFGGQGRGQQPFGLDGQPARPPVPGGSPFPQPFGQPNPPGTTQPGGVQPGVRRPGQ